MFDAITPAHLARMRAVGTQALLVWDQHDHRVQVARADEAVAWLNRHTPVLAGASALEAIEAEAATAAGADEDAVLERLRGLAQAVIEEWPHVRPHVAEVAALRRAMAHHGLYLDGPPIRTPDPRARDRFAPRVLAERYHHPAGTWVVTVTDVEAPGATYVRVLAPPDHLQAAFTLDTGRPEPAAPAVAAAAHAAAHRGPQP
ncbi:hypothetical protein FZ103_10550 [Streptomonospora sp. PA3]|uniref:hypothetical protein n=1 Tax=Streptomonospora sp. PA3 TaxID=2607326 RepID=UPI0012DCD948|nr:hypothetical protein [Streptomonospora sp. PA3]MUL41610.1 hypothetical protein [Streptomonospora sp. PA3]